MKSSTTGDSSFQRTRKPEATIIPFHPRVSKPESQSDPSHQAVSPDEALHLSGKGDAAESDYMAIWEELSRPGAIL